jgi:hypothetical protein
MHYKGSSASDNAGPVALHQMEDEEAWTLTWAQKQLYGKLGLVVVGGRGDVVDDGPDDADEAIDEAGASSHIPSRRAGDAKELACFHALPSTFWDEVAHDYQPGAILDLAAGGELGADRGAEPNHLHGLRVHGLSQGNGHGPIA